MASSLKELAKKKLLVEMIRSIQPASKWKILITDPNSVDIINSVCRLNEVLDENVTLVETIMNSGRQPYPQEAIYFISPTEVSIDRLIADFERKPPLYPAAHIFTTSSLSDELFSKIKNSAALDFVKTLKEIAVDFIPMEQQSFSLNMANSFHEMYNTTMPLKMTKEIPIMAKKLVSVFQTLSESPNIRYYDPTNKKANKSFKLASAIQKELDKLSEDDPDYPPKNVDGSTSEKGTFIILERNFDVVSPLLHEFTYQAMIHDLLVLDNGKYSIKMEEDSEKKAGAAALDEEDPIWRLIRHWHFAEAIEYISDTFKKFLGSNKAAEAALGSTDGPSGIEALNQMKDTLSALPEFQEMKSKFSLHINICQECQSVFEKRSIGPIAGIEQDLATGETSDGRVAKGIMQGLVPILFDDKIPNLDKLRLIMLYIICQEGIIDQDRKKLLQHSKLNAEDCQAINNLGLRLTPYTDSYEKKASLDLRGPYVYKGKLRDKRKRDKVDGGMSYDLSRYVPLVKLVLEDQVAGRMSTDLFPYIREPPPEKTKKQSNFSALTEYLTSDNGLLVATGNNPYSLRTMGSSWAVGAKKTGEQDNFKENQAETTNQESINLREYRKNGARVIVFIIGGMTFSEMRSSYEVMRERNREIIIGSTNVWNPSSFVDSLKKLNRKVEVTEDVVAPHRNSIAPRQSTASSRHSKNSVVPKTSSEDVSSLNSSKFIEEEDVPGVKSKGAMRGLRSKFTVKRKP